MIDREQNRRRKVVKYRKPIQINIGFIVFGIIFVYIMINVFRYFTVDHISIYEVSENTIADDNTCKGVIIREETVINTDTPGYINYFLRDSSRISKNSLVYTIDENKKVFDMLVSGEDLDTFSTEDSNKINSLIKSFQKTYSDTKFDDVYDLKYDIENSLYEASNYSMVKNLEKMLKEQGQSNSFQAVKSPKSGIVSYSIDNMENLKAEDITKKTFDNAEYKRIQLRTDKLIDKGSPVYKIVTDENWSIVLTLSKDQYDRLQSKEDTGRIRITLPKEDLTMATYFKTYEKDGAYFAKLDMNHSMIRFINERFIDVELTINSAEGLKIPVSAIVEKEFYKVPTSYFTIGGDSTQSGLVKEVYDKGGNLSFVFIPTDKYYEDDEYVYIDKDIKFSTASTVTTLGLDDWVHNAKTGDRYQIKDTVKLEGAYNVNKGYPVFRRIEKAYENKEYCIIKKDTPQGLFAYDHIVLNAHLLDEKVTNDSSKDGKDN